MLVNDLDARKTYGDLEFAEWMVACQTLRELEQIRDAEKQKVKEVNNRYYELKSIPDYAILTQRIRELSESKWNAHDSIAPVERDVRQMTARMNHLRSVIAKAEAE
jgi:hypothetical protein